MQGYRKDIQSSLLKEIPKRYLTHCIEKTAHIKSGKPFKGFACPAWKLFMEIVRVNTA
jgi:hypothetical protein